jgi:hypothetical protein
VLGHVVLLGPVYVKLFMSSIPDYLACCALMFGSSKRGENRATAARQDLSEWKLKYD